MASVVRIKRKLNEDPAEALLLTCKRKKLEEKCEGTSKVAADVLEIDKNVFHFATTLKCKSSMDKEDKIKVKEAISLHKHLKNRQMREHQKSLHTSNDEHCFASLRNKLKLGKKRQKSLPNDENSSAYKADLTLPDSDRPVIPAKVLKKAGSKSHEDADQKLRGAPVQEAINTAASGEDILCNSVKMVREKLNESSSRKDEYVFDFYYCSKELDWNHHDILDVKACR